MKEPEIRQIEDFIKRLDEKELRYINRLIVERLKLIAQRKSTIAMSRFNIGERVCFNGPDGREHSGHIFRLNKKTVSIKTIEGELWNVAPSLLKESSH